MGDPLNSLNVFICKMEVSALILPTKQGCCSQVK